MSDSMNKASDGAGGAHTSPSSADRSSVITTLNFAACSDRGLVRGNNEDSAYAGPRLLALADGMGGHAAGEVASQFVISALRPLDSPLVDRDHGRRLTTMLDAAMEEGNRLIAAHVDEHSQLEGMGCTLTALLFRTLASSDDSPTRAQVGMCHVGDSRAYRMHGGVLEQITKDDTFVQFLVDEGKLDPADVSSHPHRSKILKALIGVDVEPTLVTFTAEVGDRFLLCSDGLSDPVSFDTIRDVLSVGSPEEAARKLVEIALRGGGPDNVTVVVADVVEFSVDANAPVDGSLVLPDAPILAGAVAGEVDELPRPDSSAFRAAAIPGLSVTNSVVPDRTSSLSGDSSASSNASESVPSKPHSSSAVNSMLSPAGSQEHDASSLPAEQGRKASRSGRKKAIFTILIVLSVLMAMGIGAFLFYGRMKDQYYVAVENSELVLHNGARGTVLGINLSSPYEVLCLDRDSTVTFMGIDEAHSSEQSSGSAEACHRFSTEDLTPAAQGLLMDLPEGSYADVRAQVKRLSEKTLPVCKSEPVAPSPDAAEQAPAPVKDSAATPGVSCREVA